MRGPLFIVPARVQARHVENVRHAVSSVNRVSIGTVSECDATRCSAALPDLKDGLRGVAQYGCLHDKTSRLQPQIQSTDAQVHLASCSTEFTPRRSPIHHPIGCPNLAAAGHLPRLSKRDAGQARARNRWL